MKKIVLTSALLICAIKISLAQDITKYTANKEAKQQSVGSAAVIITDAFGASASCVTKQSTSIEVKSEVATGACLNVIASESIDITAPFDSKQGSVFDASIVAIPITPTTPTTPTPTTPIVSTKCENFNNHTSTDPHIFAKASTNEFYGECISEQIPEYKIDGLTGWKKMARVSGVVGSTTTFLHTYHESFDGVARNTFIRSREGCTEYPDIRTERVNKDLLRSWVLLPSLAPIVQDKTERVLFVNTELEGASLNSDIVVYNIYTDRPVPNLRGRINGTTDVAFNQTNWGWFFVRPAFDVSATDVFNAKKDFVLDISTDNFKTAQRFVVYRNHQGGHYTATITMTRADGRVFVTTHSINYEVAQKLVNKATGVAYYSIPKIDGVFDLGYLDDGDYNFELRTVNDYVAESDIMVRVKKKL